MQQDKRGEYGISERGGGDRMREQKTAINIIGAGLAGLSAALTCARQGIRVRLVSLQPSERAQSNLAEGGINAALNVMGEEDAPSYHYEDTMKGGCFMADPNMVRNLTQAAPALVRELDALGVPFHREDGHIVQRSFGGQKKKRTTYAKSSTGKVLMTALTDEVRKYEARGLVERYPHHRFECLLMDGERLTGVQVFDRFRKRTIALDGAVIMACGGTNGLFAGATTGTTANTGSASAALFSQGVTFANLEFLQYHPTTVSITGKRLLVSEAARGEGGRLFCIEENEERCYFMEEKYGERGNLMPRDVISREMSMLGKQAYLDLTGLDEKTWRVKLSDLRQEVQHYLGIAPAQQSIPVAPGIHYFMGGILTDERHRTSLSGLYAAGECACAYHGANRLGGNSLLGAVFGGRTAAETLAGDLFASGDMPDRKNAEEGSAGGRSAGDRAAGDFHAGIEGNGLVCRPWQSSGENESPVQEAMTDALLRGLAPLRDESGIREALNRIRELRAPGQSDELKARLLLAEAILRCAEVRRESRGAHTRLDYPDTLEEFHRTTAVRAQKDGIVIRMEEIPKLSGMQAES